jgi:hypothetical protein
MPINDRELFRLRRRDILALMGGAAAAGAIGLPAWSQEAKRGGVLKIAAPANPSSLDPATGGAGSITAFSGPCTTRWWNGTTTR